MFTRCESSIAYDWGAAGPGNGLGTDNFSVRWTGRFDFAAASYVFTARADDGIRVWVDGASVIDAWKDQGVTTYQASVPLTAGAHDVKVEYYEHGVLAEAEMSWAASAGGGERRDERPWRKPHRPRGQPFGQRRRPGRDP